MNDHEFVERFEACTLPEDAFHHRDHVRLAYLYLCWLPPLEALARFTTGIKRFAASLGKADRYHETITWAYLLLIHERLQRDPADDFETFARANPDLLAWHPSVLDSYYRPDTLRSDLARRAFVMPDGGRLPVDG
jgi:hypothetical protein